MIAWKSTLLLLTGVALLAAGCTLAPVGTVEPAGDSPLPVAVATLAPAPTDALPPETTPAASPLPAQEAAPTEDFSQAGVPGDLLNGVLEDAALQLGVAPDSLVVTEAEAVTWPDGSLGCPEPGMFYTQAMVDGYRIVVEAEGQALDYRVQSSGFFRICESRVPRGNRP